MFHVVHVARRLGRERGRVGGRQGGCEQRWTKVSSCDVDVMLTILEKKIIQKLFIFCKQECPVEEWNQLVKEARAKVANITRGF